MKIQHHKQQKPHCTGYRLPLVTPKEPYLGFTIKLKANICNPIWMSFVTN